MGSLPLHCLVEAFEQASKINKSTLDHSDLSQNSQSCYCFPYILYFCFKGVGFLSHLEIIRPFIHDCLHEVKLFRELFLYKLKVTGMGRESDNNQNRFTVKVKRLRCLKSIYLSFCWHRLLLNAVVYKTI